MKPKLKQAFGAEMASAYRAFRAGHLDQSSVLHRCQSGSNQSLADLNLQPMNAMIQSVKKLILIFLLMLLPLQFSWAAAAVYCQHEQEQTTHHFGHHSHQHEAKADPSDDNADHSAKVHDDCGYCHLSCQASFVMASFDIAAPDGWTYLELYPISYSSHLPDGPKRPDWRFVA
jgi:carbon starvation protein CstA